MNKRSGWWAAHISINSLSCWCSKQEVILGPSQSLSYHPFLDSPSHRRRLCRRRRTPTVSSSFHLLSVSILFPFHTHLFLFLRPQLPLIAAIAMPLAVAVAALPNSKTPLLLVFYFDLELLYQCMHFLAFLFPS